MKTKGVPLQQIPIEFDTYHDCMLHFVSDKDKTLLLCFHTYDESIEEYKITFNEKVTRSFTIIHYTLRGNLNGKIVDNQSIYDLKECTFEFIQCYVSCDSLLLFGVLKTREGYGEDILVKFDGIKRVGNVRL